MSNAVVIFIRVPQQGKVKTRLAKTLGDQKAAGFYRLCIETVVSETRRLSRETDKYIFFAEPVYGHKTDYFTASEFKLEVQEGESLGQRLSSAFFEVFRKGAHKAVIVASDVPDLTADMIKNAFNVLDKSDIVIGPCYDGGYYLIGMKQLHKELFQDIHWGTERVLRQTLDAITDEGLTVEKLPVLMDIDTEQDLRKWIAMKGSSKPRILDFIAAWHL
jgi:rSAM/selenodomain-associated transferase 1